MTILSGPKDNGVRLDVFLARELPGLTRSRIQSLNRSGSIRIDGREEKAGYAIKSGETVEIDLKPAPTASIEAISHPLHIHYEDEDLAVIEKPAGLTVHPGAGTASGPTLVNVLMFHFKNLSSRAAERPGIVHRLDKWTSGLMIVAKNDRAHVLLSEMFSSRLIEKRYRALVHGRPRKSEGEITMTIGRHGSIRTRMAAGTPRGRAAWTEYRVVEDLGGFSLLDVRLKTGRTHQIRVHLSAIAHPVAGDNVYGAVAYKRFRSLCGERYAEPERFFLHASDLEFAHPLTSEKLTFHSSLPADFSTVVEYLRSRSRTA